MPVEATGGLPAAFEATIGTLSHGTDLFRDDSDFYPIANASYYLPASGSVFRFGRAPDGSVDRLITVRPESGESFAPRAPRNQ